MDSPEETMAFVARMVGWCFAYWLLRQATHALSFLAWPRDADGLDAKMKGLPCTKRLFVASRVGAFLHAIVSCAVCAYVTSIQLAAARADASGALLAGRATGVPLSYDQVSTKQNWNSGLVRIRSEVISL